jgi:hypothetical protein
MPSLLTGYPQDARISGDDVRYNRSDVPYLSRAEKQKDGPIA